MVVRVCDSGLGVPDAFVHHLFETFTQGHAGPVGGSGAGLGLAIVKGLAEAAEGRAWYEPNVPHGSCFCVSLPHG